jgi:hypothetical protein
MKDKMKKNIRHEYYVLIIIKNIVGDKINIFNLPFYQKLTNLL